MMRQCRGKRNYAARLATKRRGRLRPLDFAGYRAEYIAMVIIELDQKYGGCPGMSFHTNAALLDCDVSEHMLRDHFALEP